MAEPSRARPWDQNEQPAGSFGAWLRRQREAREVGLREIAEASKISLRYLEALEQDRFEILPAPVFAKGFLREYARFVGLDADDVVNRFLAAQAPEQDEDDEEVSAAPPVLRRPQSVWSLGLSLGAGAVLVLSLVVALTRFGDRFRSEPPVPAMAAPVTPEAPELEATEPSPEAALRVTLDFTQNCWVEAYVDGERVVSEFRVQGESLRLDGSRLIRLSLGNVSGVRVEVNGVPYPVSVADRTPFEIDLETARRLREDNGRGE